MFEHYIVSGKKKLRCGYTTGTCATLATKAAAVMLLKGHEISGVAIVTPKGIRVEAEIEDIEVSGDRVACSIRKDAGDDRDATNGILIRSRVGKIDTGVVIDGGRGVGRITKKGLDRNIGEAAINSTPLRMIGEALTEVSRDFNYTGGFSVIIEAVGGEEIAKKTFNPNLGIVGGISIIGTSGIVEPMSMKSLADSIRLEIKMAAANAEDRLIITPGNYGTTFIDEKLKIGRACVVKCSNFIGDAVDFAGRYGFKRMIIAAHMGKAVKLAGNMMNTHSVYGDCRREIFASHSAANGADTSVSVAIMNAVTSDACIEVLMSDKKLFDKTMGSIMAAAQANIDKRAGDDMEAGLVTFTNEYGLIGISDKAKKIIDKWRGEE